MHVKMPAKAGIFVLPDALVWFFLFNYDAQMSEKAAPLPPDSIYRRLFSHKEVMAGFLRHFIPQDIAKELDLDTLEIWKGDYATSALRLSANDLIWRLKLADQWIYIYVMLEFQSSPHADMNARIARYCLNLQDLLIKAGERKESGLYAPICPIVIYNGSRAWNYPLSLAKRYPPLPESLRKLNLAQEFILVNLRQIRANILAKIEDPAAWIVKIEQAEAKGPLETMRTFIEAANKFGGPEWASFRETLAAWIAHMLEKHGIKDTLNLRKYAKEGDLRMLEEETANWREMLLEEGREEGRREAENWREMLLEEGIGIGREKGRVEGIGIGREEGIGIGREEGIGIGKEEQAAVMLASQIAMLKEMAAIRFGALPESWEQRLDKLPTLEVVNRLMLNLFAGAPAKDFEDQLFKAANGEA